MEEKENIFEEKNLIDEGICSAKDGKVIVSFDILTGEILENVNRIKTDIDVEYEKAMKDAYIKRKRIVRHNQLTESGKSQFYMLKYSICAMIEMGVSLANVTRIIYLATYMTYDNVLVTGNNKKMDKKKMQEIMGLKRETFRTFYQEAVKAHILKENPDSSFSITNNIFHKGKIVKLQPEFKYMYMKNLGIRELYESVKSSEHSRLAYLFMMIPFVHMKFNILCWNPLEENFDKIELMSFKQLGELFNVKNVRQLSHYLRFYQVDGRHLIAQTVVGNTRRIFVNPSLYSSGYCEPVTIHRIFEAEDRKEKYDIKEKLGLVKDKS